jgi:aminoglycoside 3-N-acetyltransferase I
MPDIEVERLTVADVALARTLFATMAGVFETEAGALSDRYLTRLLQRDAFWALGATVDGQVVGGLTAHTLPLARSEESELFLYDLAVLPAWQRQGVGRQLVSALRAQAARAGISVAFVAADDDDTHALDFYRAIGGVPTPVTIFTFGDEAE